MALGPPTHPPIQPIPSTKFALISPFKALFNTSLHSLTPSALTELNSLDFSGYNSATASPTAMETPPVRAYNLPPLDA